MSYLMLKHAHMTLAAISGTFFLIRGMWMLAASSMLQRAWVRSMPHLVDSLLLTTAIALAWWSGQSPVSSPWLGAKVVALVAYILLGSVALKHGKTRLVRAGAFIAALGCFAYIGATAMTKNPLFFL
ncbi:SirB2 family protein [Massilia cavernae]|uniref:Regulator SirB n=1 Tax=Massilia cavernae TaxID=2320864 RepID=A0A418XA94_9BURK|nr:SirB2 family protein [Massilia cavernae]RJG09367.1 regulator SirB [Massilia cavernae]